MESLCLSGLYTHFQEICALFIILSNQNKNISPEVLLDLNENRALMLTTRVQYGEG